MPKEFREICSNCGNTYGSHLNYKNEKYPKDYCPGDEGRMNWSEGPGTTFKGSGKLKEKEGKNP